MCLQGGKALPGMRALALLMINPRIGCNVIKFIFENAQPWKKEREAANHFPPLPAPFSMVLPSEKINEMTLGIG